MKSQAGLKITWGAEHKSSGRLISRQVSIEPPEITCVRISCLWKYAIKSLTYTLVLLYHQCRVAYAEKNRNKGIPLRYRTGEPMPDTIWQAIKEIIKLKIRR